MQVLYVKNINNNNGRKNLLGFVLTVELNVFNNKCKWLKKGDEESFLYLVIW